MAAPPPLVTVVVATYRRPSLALEAVRSVVENGWPSFEVVVVDQDPARQLEGAIRARFPGEDRVRCVHLDRAVLSAARNLGLARSHADIVVFLDDDAVLERGSLGAYVDAFSTPPRPAVVAGRLVPLWTIPRPAWYPPDKEYLLGVYGGEGALAPMPEQDLPVGANFAVLRSAARVIGPFDERLGYSHARADGSIGGEDSHFTLRARAAGMLVLYQPGAVARHRIAASKLRFSSFLSRCYWEGATTARLQHVLGRLTGEQRLRLVRAHRRIVRRELLHLLGWRRGRWRLFSRREWAAALGTCAQSLGVLGFVRRPPRRRSWARAAIEARRFTGG